MLKARLIRIKSALVITKNKITNIFSPSVRQDNLGVAIEVVTDRPVQEFLLKALEIASGKFVIADNEAGTKKLELDSAKLKFIGAEKVRAVRAKQLSIVADVVDKQK